MNKKRVMIGLKELKASACAGRNLHLFQILETEKPADPKKGNLFGAKRTTIDGIEFHSKHEGRRYVMLKFMQKAGLIKNLKLQVPYGLSICTYIADFVYFDVEKNMEVVEDAKSPPTRERADYVLKKKMMLAEKGITIFEYLNKPTNGKVKIPKRQGRKTPDRGT